MKSHRSRALYRLRRSWINEIIKLSNEIEKNNNKFQAAQDNHFADYPTMQDKTNFILQKRALDRLIARKIAFYIKML